jgi:hypothetical protein
MRAKCVSIVALRAKWLPGLQRAGPSAPLDEHFCLAAGKRSASTASAERLTKVGRFSESQQVVEALSSSHWRGTAGGDIPGRNVLGRGFFLPKISSTSPDGDQ